MYALLTIRKIDVVVAVIGFDLPGMSFTVVFEMVIMRSTLTIRQKNGFTELQLAVLTPVPSMH